MFCHLHILYLQFISMLSHHTLATVDLCNMEEKKKMMDAMPPQQSKGGEGKQHHGVIEMSEVKAP